MKISFIVSDRHYMKMDLSLNIIILQCAYKVFTPQYNYCGADGNYVLNKGKFSFILFVNFLIGRFFVPAIIS